MFVFLSKFLPQFIYPIGLSWLLIFLVLFLLRHKKDLRWVKRILWIVVVVIFIAGNQWVSAILARSLEWRYLPPENMPLNSVVVVLGGGTESEQYPRQMPEVGGAGDRVTYALKLYRDGVAGKLLLSGGNIEWLGSRSSTGAQEMVELLTLMGVPKDIMQLQNESRNTYEDALYCAEILKKLGVSEIILVTSASHMPRSVALFQKQGLTVIPAPADFGITAEGWTNLWHPSVGEVFVHLVPSASDLSSTQTVLKEYIGILMYKLRGWL
ncbi:MAG: hypothetical protein CVU46_07845 [Chloroflexi bacterium HGW-Chloroflexi-8]|nr:MAG: hypothetical protein CVU46_07845 [Chloroflexi bacterium HGW-Chloroflexi-8]